MSVLNNDISHFTIDPVTGNFNGKPSQSRGINLSTNNGNGANLFWNITKDNESENKILTETITVNNQLGISSSNIGLSSSLRQNDKTVALNSNRFFNVDPNQLSDEEKSIYNYYQYTRNNKDYQDFGNYLANTQLNHTANGNAFNDYQSHGKFGKFHIGANGISMEGGFQNFIGHTAISFVKDSISAGISLFTNAGNFNPTGGVKREIYLSKSSDSGWGIAFGAGFNGTPLLTLDIYRVVNGVKYTVPVGDFLSGLSMGNIFMSVGAVAKALQPERMNIPRHEVIYPDDTPERQPKVALFKTGTTELTKSGLEQLNESIDVFLKNKSLGVHSKIELGQYHDEDWFSFWNKDQKEKLSSSRAEVIKQLMVQKGISPEDIKIGHTEVNQNDSKLTVQDHNTAVRYIIDADKKLVINDKVHFNSSIASPLAESKKEEIMKDPAFKELMKGKSFQEEILATNLLFERTHTNLNGKPKSLSENIADLKHFYDKGLTIQKVLLGQSLEEVSEQNKSVLNDFVQKHNIGENPENINKFVSELAKNGHISDYQQGLDIYHDRFASRGLEYGKLDEYRKEFDTKLATLPEMKNIEALSGKYPEEMEIIKSRIFFEYIRRGSNQDFNDMGTASMALNKYSELLKHQGAIISEDYVANKSIYKNHSYVNEKREQINKFFEMDDVKNYFNSEEFKQITKANKTTPSKEIESLKDNLLTDMVTQNLNKPDILASKYIAAIYDKGLTIDEYQRKSFMEKNNYQPVNIIQEENTAPIINMENIKQSLDTLKDQIHEHTNKVNYGF